MTLRSAEIHLSFQYGIGHMYTAVSRVTDLKNLGLVMPVAKSTGKPVNLDFFMDTQSLNCHPIVFQKF